MGFWSFIAGAVVTGFVLMCIFNAHPDPHAAATAGKHVLNATMQTAKIWGMP